MLKGRNFIDQTDFSVEELDEVISAEKLNKT